MIDTRSARAREATEPTIDQNIPRAKRGPSAERRMRSKSGRKARRTVLRDAARLSFGKVHGQMCARRRCRAVYAVAGQSEA